MIATCALAPAGAQPGNEALRARVEQLHDHKVAVVGSVRLMRPEAVSHFFQARHFTPAWSAARVDQIRDAIAAIDRDGLTPSDYHLAAIDAARAAPASPERDSDLQILVTDAVAALVDHVRFGRVKPATLDRRWNVDPRQGAPALESLVAEVADAASPAAAIDAGKPSHFIYVGLKQALAAHRARATAGTWPIVPAGPPLLPGAADPRVAVIRQRLAAAGATRASPDSQVYDAALVAGVRQFQEQHRLTADGSIGPATLAAMNIPVAERLDQIRVNLERARWVIGGLSDTFILANLAAFKVYYIRDGKNVWETRAQVGKAGRQTPAFRADLRYLVFNPDWTVPPTILAQDVLAPMRKGQNAIASKRLTILDRQGQVVAPGRIDWSAVTARTFPYTLRQPPGADNALGRVKFIFPNEHAIFLHDTPSRQLFSADERTFSSGCIRVEHPLDLAALLLAAEDGWTRDRLQAIVDQGKTETVYLPTPLPVLIVYWTVSVGASGELRYARDVYNRDAALLGALNRADGR